MLATRNVFLSFRAGMSGLWRRVAAVGTQAPGRRDRPAPRDDVRREADLLIESFGPLAHRYACDHIRYAERRRRKRDVVLYTAVAREIASRTSVVRRVACFIGAMSLADWPPVLGSIAAIA